jgi:hypothetical protein
MPKTWWARPLMAVYFVGYFGYIIGAAIYAWSHLGFDNWYSYLFFQCLYAIIWPVFALIALAGAFL